MIFEIAYFDSNFVVNEYVQSQEKSWFSLSELTPNVNN